MKKFKFFYTRGGSYTFPLIPIILKNKQNRKQTGYVSLVDSGAVFSVFHTDVAEALGIKLQNIKQQVLFRGVGKRGGDFTGKPYIINLMVAQKGHSHEFECMVVFSNDIDKNGHPLLGMGGFFDNFKTITFNNQSQNITLDA